MSARLTRSGDPRLRGRRYLRAGVPLLRSFRFALVAIIAGLTCSSALEASSSDDATLLEPGLWRFERAQFATSGFGRPGDDAQWRQVELPESWSRTAPKFSGTAWYRLRIDLSHAAGAPYAIYIANRRGFDLDAWVNGELFGRELGWSAMGGVWHSPIYFTIPPALLKLGRNTVEISIRGDANFWAGLGRVTFGEARRVEQVRRAGTFLQTTADTAQILTISVLAALALALWMARRREPLALWFGLAMLSWVALVSINRWTLGTDIGSWRAVLAFLLWTILPLSSASACLIAAERRAPLLHALLWGSLAAG
ncbi:MAG: beta galactosidase jelly roll domain-containing protein, partial [Pseudomonadota bacterium]